MRRHYPGPYGRTCGYWCRYLKTSVPRAVSAQQNGSGRLKSAYSDSIPAKLRQPNPGGKQ